MAEIPKLVAQRLKETARPQSHPDANMLTAFVENALRGSEREQVLSHLSQCRECREIVILATPAEEISTANTAPAQQWFRWPTLQWVAAAACVLIVGTAVMLRRPISGTREQAQMHTMTEPAKSAGSGDLIAKAQDSEKVVARQVPPSALTSQVAGETRATVVTRSRRDEAPLKQRAGASEIQQKAKEAQGALPAGPAEYDKLAAIPAQAAPTAALAPLGGFSAGVAKKADIAAEDLPSANERVSVESSIVALDAAPRVSADELKDARRVSSKKAAAATMSMAGSGHGNAVGALAKSESIWPHWRLSPEETLERSVDSGESWQPITVPPGFKPRAVAAAGPHVWVGGTSGMLYHSSDLGEHWSQVQPAFNKQSLAGDIIRIEFSNTQNGALTTSTGETWRTADGGLHWLTP